MSVQSPAKPRFQLLSQWLKEPDTPMRWIIDQWMNEGSRILTYAQWKAGKTTLISNLVRSVADGDPFLGEAATTPLNDGETIVLLDFEMSDKQLKEWTRIQGIQHTDRVVIKPLRGEARTFNLLDSISRAQWVLDLRGVNCKFLIVDCIGPVMSALDLDESNNTQVAKFLRLIDELLVEAGIQNCWLVHHMGHDEKKPRGASTVLGWCDVTITLSRRGNASNGQRSIQAAGRGVSQAKRDLHYDEKTHRFTIAPEGAMPSVTVGDLKTSKVALEEPALQDALKLLRTAGKPLGASLVIQLLKQKRTEGWATHSDKSVRDGLKLGAQRGELVETHVGKELQYAVTPSPP